MCQVITATTVDVMEFPGIVPTKPKHFFLGTGCRRSLPTQVVLDPTWKVRKWELRCPVGCQEGSEGVGGQV